MTKMLKKYDNQIIYIVAVLIILLVLSIFFGLSRNMGESMLPNISEGSFNIILKKEFCELKRGDFVIIDYEGELIGKRIIGTPGETMEFCDGNVIVDNKILKEEYIDCDTVGNGKYIVPNNEFFVMGDNRYNSFDSRFMDYPYIKRGNVIGKVIFVLDFSTK